MSETHLKGTLRGHEGWGPHSSAQQLLLRWLPAPSLRPPTQVKCLAVWIVS